ncbi:MAG: hypothetical protein OXO51_15970 [Gemmatimonadota bacterium]|nr:hypothetical protein [Gemmatimonadota bacterium]
MAKRYLRELEVEIGGEEFSAGPAAVNAFGFEEDPGVLPDVRIPGEVVIKDLYIRFRVRREVGGAPADGFVDVYNLTPQSEERIRTRGERVKIRAGYDGEMAQIFDGDVRRVERVRHELDRITRVLIGGMAVRQARAVFNRTYAGETPVRTIFSDAVKSMGFDVGPLDLIPEDATETDFTYNEETRVLLEYIVKPYDLTYYETDGVIGVTRIGSSADDRPQGVQVNERTGMIGTPTVTDKGIRLDTLLDPRLKIDTRVRIESLILEDDERGNQAYKVVALVHQGDNREGPFNTVAELRPVA